MFNQFEEKIPPPAEFEEPYGNIACMGSTRLEAAAKLLSVTKTLRLDDNASISIDHFMHHLLPHNP